MDFNEYHSAAVRTAKLFGELGQDLAHASLGLCTEAGEFTTEVKRIAIYSKPMTLEMRAHMLEELGDTLWYIALACEHLQCPMDRIARDNIDKLRKRYPEKYTDQAAEERADKGGLPASQS